MDFGYSFSIDGVGRRVFRIGSPTALSKIGRVHYLVKGSRGMSVIFPHAGTLSTALRTVKKETWTLQGV